MIRRPPRSTPKPCRQRQMCIRDRWWYALARSYTAIQSFGKIMATDEANVANLQGSVLRALFTCLLRSRHNRSLFLVPQLLSCYRKRIYASRRCPHRLDHASFFQFRYLLSDKPHLCPRRGIVPLPIGRQCFSSKEACILPMRITAIPVRFPVPPRERFWMTASSCSLALLTCLLYTSPSPRDS